MKRILIVDDRADNRYYMRALLESHGYAVDEAAQGGDALACGRARPPALAISDLLMPVMDGYTLLREWRADESLRRIPFIVCTATYTGESDEHLAMELGAAAFLRKPCNPDDLVAIVGEVIDAPPDTSQLQSSSVYDERRALAHYNAILVRKLEQKTEQLERANQALSEELTQRKRIQADIRYKNMVLETQQDVSLDAILVVGENEQILSYNRRFVALWGLSEETLNLRQDAPALREAIGLVEDPDVFISYVDYLYEHKNEASRDEIKFKDGRIIDRYSAPITDAEGGYFGRVWFFRDITDRRQYEKKLQQQSRLLQQVSAMAHVGGWAFDPATGEGNWTEQLARIHDVDPSTVPTISSGLDYYHGENRAIIEHAVHEAIKQGTPYDLTLELVSATGRHKWVRTICEPIVRDGRVIELRGAMQDVSEQKADEAHITRLNRVLALLSRINMMIVRVKNRDDLYTQSCRIAVEQGGLTMAMVALVDEDEDRIVPVASVGKDQALMEKITAILSSKDKARTMVSRAITEKRPVVANDTRQDPQILFSKDYLESGVHSMAVLPLVVSGRAMGTFALYAKEPDFFQQQELALLTDMTNDIVFAIDHLDKQERVDYLSFYDDLTGLANLRLFLDRATQDIRAAQHGRHKLAIVLVDIERFKSINDSLGRAVGDSLLKQVAQWLTHELGDANLVARINADHFGFVMTEIESRDRMECEIGKIIKAFMGHSFLLREDAAYRLGIKVGVAACPDHGTNAESLFRKAEVALKTAKRGDELYLLYSRTMDEKVAVKLSMENQLRQAIDNEEFVLHYQPKVNIETGKVAGAEALIRWNKPGAGLVSPDEFIPVLEETGLIHEVGRRVLRKAVSQYLGWRADGLQGVRISVNVSPIQLRKTDFMNIIKRKADIDAHATEGLDLELTESSIMENVKGNIETLQAIRNLGIHVTLDDFGTGFSSLSYLSKLPLDALKIDREFITGMTSGPEGLALVSTIINLAHSLRLRVIAEGVETEEQMKLLRLLRCDEIQGFIFSKPISADDFTSRYLKTH